MSTMGLVREHCGCLGIVSYIEVSRDHLGLLLPFLTPLEFWASEPGAVGEILCKSEGIVAVTLTVITVKRFADPFFPPRNEIP